MNFRKVASKAVGIDSISEQMASVCRLCDVSKKRDFRIKTERAKIEFTPSKCWISGITRSFQLEVQLAAIGFNI